MSRTTILETPIRIWIGNQIAYTTQYKRAMAAIGRAMKEGAAVEISTRVETPEQPANRTMGRFWFRRRWRAKNYAARVPYDIMRAVIEWPTL